MLRWWESLSPIATIATLAAALLAEGVGFPFIVVEPFFLAVGLLISAGKTSFWNVWLFAGTASFTGSAIGYSIGRHWLRLLLDRYGNRLGLTPERMGMVEGWFHRYGAGAIIIGRFAAPLRTATLYMAGATRIPFLSFAVASIVAAFAWTGAYLLAFYLLGTAALRLLHTSALYLLAAAVVLGGVALLLWYRARRHHLSAPPAEEEATEEPEDRRQDVGDLLNEGGLPHNARRRTWRWMAVLLLALAFTLFYPALYSLFVSEYPVILAIATAFLFPAGYLYWQYWQNTRIRAPLLELPPPSGETRLLFLAPHPDDEALAAGGILQQVLKAGGEVQVAVLTCGDGFWRAAWALKRTWPTPDRLLYLGKLRLGESQQALAHLGVPKERMTYWGFPDGEMGRLWLRGWQAPITSRNTGASSVPYELPTKSIPYQASNLVKLLGDLLDDFQPNLILAPYPLDGHPDHRATYNFLLYALATRPHAQPTVYTYVVHHGEWPSPWGLHPHLFLGPPRELARYGPWLALNLEDEEAARKGEAIGLYSSQMRVMAGWLLSFARADEIFTLPAIQEEVPEEKPILLPMLPPTLKDRLDPGTALLSAVLMRKGSVWNLTLRVLRQPRRDRQFRLRLWLFSDDGKAVGHVLWREGLKEGHETLLGREPLSFQTALDGSAITFSWTLPKGTVSLLLGADTGTDRRIEDRSGWMLLRLKP
ncbi:MAG: PIG-L family deacetylase [Bacillota bacterium]|nr:PIG-L family deacetylase [Bacillota bacterium]